MNTKDLERTLKALANKRRLIILGYIKKHPEATVGEIASAIRLSFKATSKHLAILRSANLVEREQKSIEMFYHLAPVDPAVRQIITLL